MTPKIVTSFIGGEWVEPNESSHKIKIIHPADEQHISTLYEADTNEVSNAAETAKKAGLRVVMNRCPKIELFRPFWKPRLDLKI